MKLETILSVGIGVLFAVGAVVYFLYGGAGTTGPMPEIGGMLTLEEKAKAFEPAPDISSADGFINTDGEPITISQFKGDKVVLVDFWTYSCINCQRTLPYLKEWDEKYRDQGLVIVGLHTPEFSFEHDIENVREAVDGFGIKYPVVLDNDYSTWRAFGNRYWPRKYLIDIDGFIVYNHIGEGGYEETEKAIQKALLERNARLGNETGGLPEVGGDLGVEEINVGSPEVYFGSMRNELLGNGTRGFDGEQTFTEPSVVEKNVLYLVGSWFFESEYAEGQNAGKVIFQYEAKNVYMVASSEARVDVDVYKNGEFIQTVDIKEEKLYTLVSGDSSETATLELRVKGAGLRAFTFTFG